ncbi:two component, sigma54 specific, transcriptional regulator, Fis family [Desulfovibrio sp. X2]|uniref:sigma-54-dependent transcriptional regulator n=1 Tax=Desulfovibrio sp. X2 TaxID=941449 RepID=UPI000358A6B8|nr:sigma-54 dependent transcriptional regulator [Desulfovibrio sp. X2]EPR44353.1 two component, sigma54 specific, transcriptional regulator, Fis family [Desulfovibrio sp. X2]
MNSQYNVLVVDDEQSIVKLFKKELTTPERAVHCAGTGRQARDMVRKSQYEVVVLDLRLPDSSGLELLAEFRQRIPDVEVIIISGHGDIDSAVEAMKLGAYDYVTKPFNLDEVEIIIERAYQRVCLQRENRSLKHSQSRQRPAMLVGRSEAIKQIQFLIQKVAPTDVPVLITGESGTGKDVVAAAIHAHSERADKPLIIKNCATLQKELARSELFGHAKGAFTGATEAQDGLMSFANRGTLFLDEIGELPLGVQGSLLRVLESKAYRRVGEKDECQTDVRFLFATNRNLQSEVESGNFHEALLHRINVFNIHIPPLCERKEDIPLLVEYFLGRIMAMRTPCTVSEGAMNCLINYQWPGNIRELRNVIERSIILAEDGRITEQVLPMELLGKEKAPGNFLSMEAVERQHIHKVMQLCNRNRSQVAETLGISRKTLYRKLRQYDLE